MVFTKILCTFFLISFIAAPFGAAWGQGISESVRQAVERAEKRMLPPEVLSNIKPITAPLKAKPIVESQELSSKSEIKETIYEEDITTKQSANVQVRVVAETQINEQELKDAILEFSKPFQTEVSVQEKKVIEPKKVSFDLNVSIFNFETKKETKLNGVDFFPEYDLRDELLKTEISLASESASVRGLINTPQILPTRVDIHLKSLNQKVDIHLIDRESLPSSGTGTYLFLKLLHGGAIDIDAPYEKRIFYDENLNVSKVPSLYALFTGVRPGNVLVYYEKDKKFAEKVIGLSVGEVYYDEINVIDLELLRFNLTERNIFGEKSMDLNIDADKIRFFNSTIKANKQGLGRYEIKRPPQLENMRPYLEFGEVDRNVKFALMVGVSSNDTIEIPSVDFMKGIINQFESINIENDCIVQINFKANVKSFKVTGISQSSNMSLESIFLSRDGSFSSQVSVSDKYAFIKGTEQGIISGKIEYEKGPVDFFKTYCSPLTYLVEQI